MECSICGAQQLKIKFDITPGRQIIHCPKCGVQFLYPQLTDEELKILYSENYYLAWGVTGDQENKSTKLMKIATFQLRLELIKKFVTRGKILDVGCATGFFLEAAMEIGYEPYGVEFSEYSSSIAKKKFGEENVFYGTLEECSFENKKFDVIAMSDLIEHVRIPQRTLSKAADLLKDDGVIMIMTPDSGSLSNKFMGKRWTHYKLEHFYYFSQNSIRFVAERSGLKVVHFERSKKALNIEYLNTQYQVYKHWLLTPLVKSLHFILPVKLRVRNFYFSIGEMVVILKKE